MKAIDKIFFVIMIIAVVFLFSGCSKKEVIPPNPTVLIPIACEFDPILPLKMMVIDPKDDVEIALRIQQQSDIKSETLKKCMKVKK